MRKAIIISGLILISLFIILAITNPSVKDLKEYTGDYSSENYKVTYNRKANYLIFSTFRVSYTSFAKIYRQRNMDLETKLNSISGEYCGIFLNFYKKRQ